MRIQSMRLHPARFLAAFALAVAACSTPVPQPLPSATAGPSRAAIRADAIPGSVAFSRETGAGIEDVFVWTVGAGGEPERLTDGSGRAFDPDLAPDGSAVVYRVNPDPARDEADLWLRTIERGAGPTRLTSDPSQNNWSPAWSPDGARIAFASTRGAAMPRLWTMARDGSDLRLVTTGHGEYPDWSPDGTRLVYAAPAGSGSYELWITPADGSGVAVRLTTTPSTEFAPAWSPDGRWIAFQFDTGRAWEVWLVRPDGSDRRRASAPGEDGAWPTWTPNGLLAWNGSRGLSFLDVDTGARGVAPAAPGGMDFLSWARSEAALP